jgi:glycosyltransferase involved in cell wall biosynthesis
MEPRLGISFAAAMPIRILQLTDSISRLGGGVSESVRGLTRGLVQASDRCELTLAATADAATSLDREDFRHMAEVQTFPVHGLGPLKWSHQLGRFLAASDFSLVHLHGLWGPASRALAANARTTPPCIVSSHGMLEPWAMRRGALKRGVAWKLWDGGVLKRAACLHALCTEEWLSLRALGLENPVALIPNGVDLPDHPVTALGDSVLFLGRLHPKKGLAELLHAWALLSDPPPLRIAGWDDGGHLEPLRRLRDLLGLEGCVEFTGPAFGADKERLFREAGALILPSHSEGLPMTVLEAWAYGLPVLMTDHCHLPEGFNRRAALRVEALPFSIAEGMRDFLSLSASERLAMGARGRELVAANYSWGSVAREFLTVYEWLLGGPRPSCVQ